jgi:hypothetical protein
LARTPDCIISPRLITTHPRLEFSNGISQSLLFDHLTTFSRTDCRPQSAAIEPFLDANVVETAGGTKDPQDTWNGT